MQTALLKAHYPVEYMAAQLLVERDKTEKVINFVSECRRMGVDVLPPDVNYSGLDFETKIFAKREAPEMWARLADTPTAFMAAAPEAMARVIDNICAGGSIRDYTLSLGLQPDTLNRLADQLLE